MATKLKFGDIVRRPPSYRDADAKTIRCMVLAPTKVKDGWWYAIYIKGDIKGEPGGEVMEIKAESFWELDTDWPNERV